MALVALSGLLPLAAQDTAAVPKKPSPSKQSAATKSSTAKSASKKTASKKKRSPAKSTGTHTKTSATHAGTAAHHTAAHAGKTTAHKKSAASWRSRQTAPTPERYKEIQGALTSRGYLNGAPNGVWDSQSTEALRRFQQDQNLEANGKLNSLSLIALGLGAKRPNMPAPAAPVTPPRPATPPEAPPLQNPAPPIAPPATTPPEVHE